MLLAGSVAVIGTGLDEGVGGGSKISRYLDTINTEMKYTIAKDRNWACFVSSCGCQKMYVSSASQKLSDYSKASVLQYHDK